MRLTIYILLVGNLILAAANVIFMSQKDSTRQGTFSNTKDYENINKRSSALREFTALTAESSAIRAEILQILTDRARAQVERNFKENPVYIFMAQSKLDSLDTSYVRFFRSLSLSDEELREVRRLLAHRDLRSDVLLDKAEIQLYRDVITLPNSLSISLYSEEELEKVLGKDRFALFKTFETEVPSRALLRDLVDSPEAALNEAQVNSLVSILKESGLADNALPKNAPPSDVDEYFADQARIAANVTETAKGLLTSAQNAMLRDLLAKQLKNRQSTYEIFKNSTRKAKTPTKSSQ